MINKIKYLIYKRKIKRMNLREVFIYSGTEKICSIGIV
jgi:hypothetical protein